MRREATEKWTGDRGQAVLIVYESKIYGRIAKLVELTLLNMEITIWKRRHSPFT